MKQTAYIALFALTLTACQQGSNDNFAIDESNTANADIEILPPDETVTNDANLTTPDLNEADDSGSEPPASRIPAAFQGRWGMVPADCTSTRGDNKGMITVTDDRIRFFESTGTLTKVTQDAKENFTGTYAFTGEGMTWTNSHNLKLTCSSTTLIRKQSDDYQP